MTIYEQAVKPIITADDVTLRKMKGRKILVLKPHRRKRLAANENRSGRFYRSLAFAQDVLEEPSLRKHFERIAMKSLMTAFYEASYYYKEKFESMLSEPQPACLRDRQFD